MNSYKKGISMVSVLVMVFVLTALAGVITISTNHIVTNTYEKEFTYEYNLVKSATTDYILRNSGNIDFKKIEFDLSAVENEYLDQFDGETIVNDEISMYVIDLEKIGIYNATYGIGFQEDDYYLVSEETNEVYYQKGFSSGGNVYYKGIND